MDKAYDPHNIESKWYQRWEQAEHFKPHGDTKKDSYCIMIPPPNVTGSLHMGHAFQHTIMDALTRLHRMQGDNTLWQPGTDHAGIATQMVVERLLNAEGKSRQDLGREAFEERVWQWKEESGGTIGQQMRRLGDSPDWSRERFTMDEDLSEAVSEVFEQLFDEGIIYRGKRLVNWDPKFHTAVSDLEVLSEEEDGHLWHIRYPLSDGSGSLVVATTRPETMLGDTAVAVHPEDSRYADFVGKTIRLPLCDRDIPIIADDYVEAEFGTGCVKITPAHDFNDYEMGKRHDLPMINVLTPDAAINDEAPEKYRGMDRFEARKQIVADLEAQGLLEKIDPHKLKVPRGDRSGVVIEPLLTDQWYVKIDSLAKPAIEAVEQGDIKFVPENWSKTYFNWMHNIQDWCISRQLWWGHRIPAWYDDAGEIYVGKTEAAVREKYKLAADHPLKQDEDVLDTWFSSALWPFATLGWPRKQEDIETFMPTNVLVTGFDIIFFWVARMIMMSLKFTGKVPFKEVYITGLIRDERGEKMSKSKGNVLDPIDLIDGIGLEPLIAKRTKGMMNPQDMAKIEKRTREEFKDGIQSYGTDALRFTFCALASTSRDINFDLGRVEGYRNFCNKLWNASRYVLMNTEGADLGKDDSERQLGLADRWIQSAFDKACQQYTQAISEYRFDLAATALFEFTKNSYCDWYLELSKPVLYGDNVSVEQQRGTRFTLVTVLEKLLRMAHPMLPFITEEIWQKVAPIARIDGKVEADESIMVQAFPEASSEIDQEAFDDVEWLKQLIVAIRNLRGELNIAHSKQISLLLKNGKDSDKVRLERNFPFIQSLAKLEAATWLNDNDNVPPAATALAKHIEVFLPLAGLIDKDAELARLNKEIEKLKKDQQRISGKLANEKFVKNAPEAVVAKEREKVAELDTALAKLEQQREKIAEL